MNDPKEPITNDVIDRFCLLWTAAQREGREYNTHLARKNTDAFSARPSPGVQAECDMQMKNCAESAARWRAEARAILGLPGPVRRGSGGTIIPHRPGDPPCPDMPLAPTLPPKRPVDADDCDRAPRAVCEHGLTEAAERLLWPSPGVCEGFRFARHTGRANAGWWWPPEYTTRNRMEVEAEKCRACPEVYIGLPVPGCESCCGRMMFDCFGSAT